MTCHSQMSVLITEFMAIAQKYDRLVCLQTDDFVTVLRFLITLNTQLNAYLPYSEIQLQFLFVILLVKIHAYTECKCYSSIW